ncbi:phosphatidylinositol phosphatase PTPRQ-like isoform X2 [Saccostrea cucullata]|uniref:phosphatidylinositol phosphatase PTPRQ-like isoform X2 n=1 Tax=Saccostrea cuccullata TaxID=36930 RepID=UPI002ED0853E
MSPNCSNVVTLATNESITIFGDSFHADGASSFNITMTHDLVESAEGFNVTFTDLKPGSNYTFTVVSRSRYGELSKRSCPFSSVTRPNNPDCQRVIISYITTQQMIIDLSNVQSSGALRYALNVTGPGHLSIDSSKKYVRNLTNLSPGTQYTFNISSVGIGDMKSRRSCVIKEYTIPAKPGEESNVEIAPQSTYVIVDWKRKNGNVENYTFEIVCSCVASPCGICDPQVLYHFDDSFANVTGVIPGTYCNFTVAAESGSKLSEPLKVQIRTSEIVPGSVTDFSVKDIVLRNLTVEWKEPKCPFGEVIQYALTIINETSHPQKISIDSTNFSYTFKELKPGTFYNVSIAAVNNAGEGDATSLPIYTVESVPSEVTGLEAQNISSTTIQVSWGKPLIPNGIILQYAVVVQRESTCVQKIMMRCLNCIKKHPDTVTSLKAEHESHNFPQSLDCNDKKNITFLEKESTSFSVNVSNLEYFTEYEFVVTAYTIKGPGNSSKIKKRTSEDKPAEPTNLQVVNKSRDSIELKFSTPCPQNGRIHLLEVEYQYKTQNNCLSEGLENEKKTLLVNINSTLQETFSVKLDNLFSYWNYTITVRMATYAGFGNYSSALTVTTEPYVPGVVRNIGFGKITSRSIQLSWETPCHPNGIIEFYEIKVNGEISSTPDPLRTSFNKVNVTFLLPYRKYSFNISAKAKNVSMKGPSAKSKDVNTSTEAAKKPENVTSDPTSVTVSLSWNPPKLETGPTFYRAVAIDIKTETKKSNCTSRGFSNTSCVIQNLHPYRKYQIILYAVTNPYPPSNITLIIQTDESAPGKVADFKVSQIQNVIAPRAVNLSWLPPLEMNRNGVIRSYYVKYWIVNSKDSLKSEVKTKSYPPNISSATIKKIKPERNYTFLIFPETVANATDDDQVSTTIEIVAGAPIPLQLPESAKTVSIGPSGRVSDNEKQLSVYFYHQSLCDDRNGMPVSWYIIVAEESSIPSKLLKPFQDSKIKYENFIDKEYKTWSNVHNQDHFDPYIAKSDWDPKCNKEEVKVSFLVGEQGECEGVTGYCNGFLKPGNKYKVRFAVCTRGGCLESEFSSPLETKPNLVPAIAGSVSGVVMALVVVIAVILYLKRRRKGPFKDEGRDQAKGNDNETFSTELETKNAAKPRPVKNAEFAEHVQRMHADSNLMFSNEYKLLKETCPAHTTKAAEVQVNRIKNRYTNILAFDHSRVKLLPTEDDEGSDYINANYIPGYSSQREYIATQGPLPFTRDDFWRMIWEQNVSIIVMLTQLVERGRRKCDIYWPEATREPVYYGDLVVEIESESTLPDYVLRVMSVKLGNRTRKVKQLHYLKWPDMGCPETTWLLLNFVGATRLYLPHNDPGPIVVHCSAGVGRTGTFIAVDFLMQHVSSSDVIDIYDYVMKMRNNRPNMVQTEDQYVFIHDCIRDYINRSDEDSDDENGEGQEDQENPIYANM